MGNKIVSVPGMGNVSFPDSMSDDEIASVIRKQMGLSVADQARQSMANRQAGADLPPGFTNESLNTPDTKGGIMGMIGPQGTVDRSIAQTASDIPAYVGDVVGRVGENVGNLAHMVMNPRETVSNLSAQMNPLGPARDAAHALVARDPVALAKTAVRMADPTGGLLAPQVIDTTQNVKGMLTGDRQAAARLTGDVATAALMDKAPGVVKQGAETGAKALKYAGDTAPGRLTASSLGVAKKFFDFGAEPGDALVGHTPDVINGVQGMKEWVRGNIDKFADLVKERLDTPAANTKSIDLHQSVANNLDPAIEGARRVGKHDIANKLTEVRDALLQTADDTVGGGVGSGRSATPLQAQEFKKIIGDNTSYATEADQVSYHHNQALQQVYRAVKNDIAEAVPAVGPLNDKLASSIAADKALDVVMKSEKNAHPFWVKRVLTSPQVSFRVANTLKTMFGSPEAPLPETVPTPQPVGPPNPYAVGPPRRPTLALPPAPESAPQGWQVGEGVRNVGTRRGQFANDDAPVYAAVRDWMQESDRQAPAPKSPPQGATETGGRTAQRVYADILQNERAIVEARQAIEQAKASVKRIDTYGVRRTGVAPRNAVALGEPVRYMTQKDASAHYDATVGAAERAYQEAMTRRDALYREMEHAPMRRVP